MPIVGLAAIIALQLCPVSLGGLVTVDSADTGFSVTLPAPIPVNNTVGLADSINVNGTTISSISAVTLTLDISGGWDGDFYAYLWHQTTTGNVMVELFNRIGVTAGNSFGSSSSGMNVTFSDTGALGSIQSATGSANVPLTGNYQPDRPLSGFNGMTADGTWALFIADESSPSLGTLESWSLTVEGGPVAATPEPSTIITGAMLLLPFAASLLGSLRKSRAV